jgi:nicotinate-nucleotide adenylyltransferase
VASDGAVGILGGTFDPVHYGHLRLGEELAGLLGLANIRFIPVGLPSHRGAPRVAAAHRVEMVRLALDGNALFDVDERECRQAGPSYTVDTLTALREEWGSQRPVSLLMGSDAFVALTTWKRWEHLFDLAHLVVAHRPGFSLNDYAGRLPPALRQVYETRLAAAPEQVHTTPAGRVLPVATTALDISATSIRAMVAKGHSPRYLLPEAVIDYIDRHQLYRTLNER